MEFELGLKLTKVVDDFTSADLLIGKNRGRPHFSSTETESKFILSARLGGYKKEDLQIEINKDGTQIAIIGEKLVEEMLMVGSKVYKSRVRKGFKKAFLIPTVVDLEKIRASFNEEDLILTISMPKLVKGLLGVAVEEVKEEEAGRGASGNVHIAANGTRESEEVASHHEEEDHREADKKYIEECDAMVEKVTEKCRIEPGKQVEQAHGKIEPAHEGEEERELKEHKKESQVAGTSRTEKSGKAVEEHCIDEIPQMESKTREQESKEYESRQPSAEGQMESKHDQGIECTQASSTTKATVQYHHEKDQEIYETGSDVQQEVSDVEKPLQEAEKAESAKVEDLSAQSSESKRAPPKSSKMCTPILAGSAFLVSLIVIVIHFIKAKNQSSKVKARKP